jgi:Peptidase family S41
MLSRQNNLMKKQVLISFFILFKLCGLSQKNLTPDIEFFAAKIKTVYAGYKEKVAGNQFDDLVSKVKKSNLKDTFKLLSKLTSFFNDLHLVLYDFNIAKKIDTGKCKIEKENILKYFESNRGQKDKYEGFWLSEFGNCIIGLKKISNFPVTYNGYIIETKTKLIPGFIILKLVNEKGKYFNTDYTEEGLGYRIFLKSKFKDSNTLLVNSYGKWKKIENYKSGYLNSETRFSFTPKLTVIDTNNILLKMADFGAYNIKIYDSIIKANDTVISRTQTLIIDIRNNTGGTINNYLPLLKYIYTNPILHSGGYKLCSDYLITDLKKDIEKYYSKGDTVKAKKAEKKLISMVAKRGTFLLVPADTLSSDLPIKPYPKNVAIITNNNCVSAAELMLLDFKQSKKVKVFGEITGGALDNLDALEIELPDTKYSLFIATTKRLLTPSQPKYDNIGIKPDIEISDRILNWVDFVKKYYESK